MEFTINIISTEYNTWLGVLLYWLPLLICIYGYSVRTWGNYRRDLKDREASETAENKYYSPTDTVGDIIGRVFVCVIPIINLVAAIFDVAPNIFEKFFKFLKKVFYQPLVPMRKK